MTSPLDLAPSVPSTEASVPSSLPPDAFSSIVEAAKRNIKAAQAHLEYVEKGCEDYGPQIESIARELAFLGKPTLRHTTRVFDESYHKGPFILKWDLEGDGEQLVVEAIETEPAPSFAVQYEYRSRRDGVDVRDYRKPGGLRGLARWVKGHRARAKAKRARPADPPVKVNAVYGSNAVYCKTQHDDGGSPTSSTCPTINM